MQAAPKAIRRKNLPGALFAFLFAATLCSLPSPIRGQLYVGFDNGTVGEYNATSGLAVNSSLITGVGDPISLLLTGNTLFVVNQAAGIVGEYDATTGLAIKANFITGLFDPNGLALLGNSLFVASNGLGEYDATTGNLIKSGFGNVEEVSGFAFSGENLFVATGGVVGSDAVDQYDATSGELKYTKFITSPNGAQSIVSVPESSSTALLPLGLICLARPGRRSARAAR